MLTKNPCWSVRILAALGCRLLHLLLSRRFLFPLHCARIALCKNRSCPAVLFLDTKPMNTRIRWRETSSCARRPQPSRVAKVLLRPPDCLCASWWGWTGGVVLVCRTVAADWRCAVGRTVVTIIVCVLIAMGSLVAGCWAGKTVLAGLLFSCRPPVSRRQWCLPP